MSEPLADRVALVTGVSRRIGIGAGIAKRLLRDGARVVASGWQPHDAEMEWGEDPGGIEALLGDLDGDSTNLHYTRADLEQPDAPENLIDATIERFGSIDIVIANHARSSTQSFAEVTVEELDRCWAANPRASLLLARRMGERRETRPGGRVIFFTSGQHIGPMSNEIAYAITKGTIHQMTASIADALIDQGVTVNCINPGPVDTGYATGDAHARVARLFPAGRWGQPEDVARLVAWLVSDEAAWITGQVINSEGGWRRWARLQ